MAANSSYRSTNTALLSVTAHEAPVVVSSDEIDDRISDTLSRLRLARGLLQKVAGVEERRHYTPDFGIGEAAATAGAKALSEAGVEPGQVGVLLNTSISRDALEPAVSVEVHDRLDLPPGTLNFDITNACLGFVNGLQTASAMIDSGQVDYALVVGAEDMRRVTESTVERLAAPGTSRAQYLEEFATLTLGSGAAAAVLGRADEHPEGHRIIGGINRASTGDRGLCTATMERMVTDAKGLLEAGVDLVAVAFTEATKEWQWATGVARYVLHQVSTVHTRQLVKRLGIELSRVPLTFPYWGNVGPASLPMTLATQVDSLLPGDRVVLMGVGSGLNTSMCEIRW